MDRFVQTNNIQLHYLDHPGGEPIIVLMPGITANTHSFDGLVRAGLSPRFRVLALDLRGRGLSDKPITGYSMAEHAADVVGLLDALGLQQVVLGGHSFGRPVDFLHGRPIPGPCRQDGPDRRCRFLASPRLRIPASLRVQPDLPPGQGCKDSPETKGGKDEKGGSGVLQKNG